MIIYEKLGRNWFKEEFTGSDRRKPRKSSEAGPAARPSLQARSTERQSSVDIFCFTVTGLQFCF
jgi:hypothetical protein